MARTRAIAHSQNGKALVCGLSTRKTRTPCRTQYSMTPDSASHIARQSLLSKSKG